MNRWLGISDIDFSNPSSWTPDQKERYKNAQEKWATGMEQYLAYGKSPSLWLKRIFDRFKVWMANVYREIKNIRYQGQDGRTHEVEITPEVRKFYDNLFKKVPYVPSEKNRQARLALARDTSRGEHSEELHYQTARRQEHSSVNSSNTQSPRIRRSNDTFISQDDIERFEQLALHGTGHTILNNRFGLEFIGTGEGGQAYGFGVYFAQIPATAEYYRRYGRNISIAGAACIWF